MIGLSGAILTNQRPAFLMAAESAVCGLASLCAVQVYRPVQREGRIPLPSILAISPLKREAFKKKIPHTGDPNSFD